MTRLEENFLEDLKKIKCENCEYKETKNCYEFDYDGIYTGISSECQKEKELIKEYHKLEHNTDLYDNL